MFFRNDDKKDPRSKGGVRTVPLLPLRDGTVKVLVEGTRRARVRRYTSAEKFFLVEAEEVEEISERNVEVEALVRSVHATFEAYVKLNKRIPPEMLMSVATIDDAARLADGGHRHQHLGR